MKDHYQANKDKTNCYRGQAMYKCIYCNSEDLTVSDIIPCALTGAKLTRRFVCDGHNRFTNNNFEKATIAHWDFVRNVIGLTERNGSTVKYNADLYVDGVTIPHISISDRASIYEDKKRLFQGEQNGCKVLIGNIDKLKQKSGVRDEDVKPLDMQDATINIKADLLQLFASKEMLCTMAKIAYEWHCYVHDINCFQSDKYQEIVDCILQKKPVDDVVKICIDGIMIQSLTQLCSLGSHGVYEYNDIDGFMYVVFFFWGIIPYRIRICRTDKDFKLSKENVYDLYLYGIDGKKQKIAFGVVGNPHLVSASGVDAVRRYHKLYVTKLQQMLNTTILSLAKAKIIITDVKSALSAYKRQPDNFARFIDYESPERFQALYLLFLLNEHQEKYDFKKSFNENMKKFVNNQEQLIISNKEQLSFFLRLQKMHEIGNLSDAVERGLAFFEKICEQEENS